MSMADSLFKKDTVFLLEDDKEYSAEEILQNIGKRLSKRGYVKESFGNALIEREKKYPTGLKPSLILTTTSANLFKHTSLPVITIMPTLEAEDVLAINQEISRLKREKVVFGLPDGIEKYFEEELYFPQIELENRESVLEYLCNKIVQKGYASEELFANTLEREKIAPTAFANQIAMPHPMRSCAYKTVIAVATLKKPIFWGNLNVRLVFLLVVRGSDMRYMNSFFDLTAKLVWEKKKIKKLLSLSQFEEFIEELV